MTTPHLPTVRTVLDCPQCTLLLASAGPGHYCLSHTCPDCGQHSDTDFFVSSGIAQHCCAAGIVRSAREEGVQITSAQHEDLPGVHTVHYRTRAGLTFLSVTYPTRRVASIQSMLVLFPGTSRAWVAGMHQR